MLDSISCFFHSHMGLQKYFNNEIFPIYCTCGPSLLCCDLQLRCGIVCLHTTEDLSFKICPVISFFGTRLALLGVSIVIFVLGAI